MGAGSSRPMKGMQEIFRKTSQQYMDEHEQFIARFLERGYKIYDQDTTEDIGEGNQLIRRTMITELHPPVKELPQIKLEASEVFGHYFESDATFDPFDDPAFEMKAYKKSGDLTKMKEPWQAMDLKS